MMECFSLMFEDVKGRLGRPLVEKEELFLQWIYEQYCQEQEKDL